ncbi:hypothetical protein JGH11_03105 [Dysgonomonas sp. Marseille-P4677]|uniref:hypothetical protein n=1 Tax=Dysgonomonas sp. Marseille-P4677 TaxID=2364790 RepID=UPI001914BDE3|nr:hypothetical protein [Dysgonomonas sp. Marseille-P4677]MBK5719853.1 hypothetical protein [Dysgonomonas sp. Marseille-P4677]
MKALLMVGCTLFLSCSVTSKIDREALVMRHNPVLKSVDPLTSLSAGNGNFAFTVDITGLQTFPEHYAQGVPLGTQSYWGWHSFPNDSNYLFDETLETYDFGHGHLESYPIQVRESGRRQNAVNYMRANPHRLHLGTVGLELSDKEGEPVYIENLSDIDQRLDLWTGIIESRFSITGTPVKVQSFCHPEKDLIVARINSDLIFQKRLGLNLRFPYPTAKDTDDGCDWNSPDRHKSKIIRWENSELVIKRDIDSTCYYIQICWEGNMEVLEKEPHYFVLLPSSKEVKFTVEFLPSLPDAPHPTFAESKRRTVHYWKHFWKSGGAVDLSGSTDKRAEELERRIVLSQYLTAIQCSGIEPPQETGLTYNSWYGKFHLEMHWWHAVHFALWNRLDLLERSLDWYAKVEPVARKTAERQGFEGIRWMKMTDPSGQDSPSCIGPFLIWQQPHIIYLAELIYRQKQSEEVLVKYKHLVFETAKFMASFAFWDSVNQRYVLKGMIPAQETMRPEETVNSPFELSYWHYGLSVAQQWRERTGLEREPKWDDIINRLSVLAEKDGLYLAAESAPQTYQDSRFTSDHMAVLGAYGILPKCDLFQGETMRNTLNWIWSNWNWDHTWGWDFPMVAMSAARLGEPEKAVGALLMNKRTNTYLSNGHNYQNERLRIYLPGNGGLLTAIAMMCAGWDGQTGDTPGFPKNDEWNVRWEGLISMP